MSQNSQIKQELQKKTKQNKTVAGREKVLTGRQEQKFHNVFFRVCPTYTSFFQLIRYLVSHKNINKKQPTSIFLKKDIYNITLLFINMLLFSAVSSLFFFTMFLSFHPQACQRGLRAPKYSLNDTLIATGNLETSCSPGSFVPTSLKRIFNPSISQMKPSTDDMLPKGGVLLFSQLTQLLS